MPNLTLEDAALISRRSSIRKLLAPLSHRSLQGGPACDFVNGLRAAKGIAVHDGQKGADFHEWSFPTIANDLRASYFEIWHDSKKGAWRLHCAYLTLVLIDKIKIAKQEYFCLHCDPYEPDDAAHAIYKQSPHVHIEKAEFPLPRAHIPLSLGHTKDVLSSVENFDAIFKLAIQMIRDEILDLRIKMQ